MLAYIFDSAKRIYMKKKKNQHDIIIKKHLIVTYFFFKNNRIIINFEKQRNYGCLMMGNATCGVPIINISFLIFFYVDKSFIYSIY